MQHSNNGMPNERQVHRTPGLQTSRSPLRKLLLLGTCVLLASLALGIFMVASPTTPTFAAPPHNPGLLSTNPSILDNLNTNRACGNDTHGGAPYVSCTITLKNTSDRNSVRWSVSSSNPHSQLNPRSGKLAPNASVRVFFNEGGLACPDRTTLTFTGPFNVVKVPVICNDIVVTPNKYSFSSKSCTRDGRGNWTCMVRVAADPQNNEPVQWTAKVITSSAVSAIKLFPANGTVSRDRRGSVTIDRSQFVKITVPASWGCKYATIFFYAPGTPQLSRPQNMLNWSCPRR